MLISSSSGVDGTDLSTIGKALSENRYNDLQVPIPPLFLTIFAQLKCKILDLSNNSISSGQQAFVDGLKGLRHGLTVLNLDSCGNISFCALCPLFFCNQYLFRIL